MKIFNLANIKPYAFFLILLLFNLLWYFVDSARTTESFHIMFLNVSEMLLFLPPIFILLGLLDVWTNREQMMRFMGSRSGFCGVFVAFLIGSFAAGPLYVAFPIAGLMLKKGASLSNVFIFIGAWAITKVPMLLFESSTLGLSYTLVRLFFNCIAILGIALILQKCTTQAEQEEIYKQAENLQENAPSVKTKVKVSKQVSLQD